MYIITGLKIAKGLRYSKQRANRHKASLNGGGHITDEAAVEGKWEGELGGENTGKQACVQPSNLRGKLTTTSL